MTRKKDDANPVGRPNEGISEEKITVRMPQELVDAMHDYAAAHEVSSSEAWRRAARAFLGLENRLPEDA
jgi:metal-responsive CopG/Arc/MetJ family transcriptional regulator